MNVSVSTPGKGPVACLRTRENRLLLQGNGPRFFDNPVRGLVLHRLPNSVYEVLRMIWKV
jgi:hypothetical protein